MSYDRPRGRAARTTQTPVPALPPVALMITTWAYWSFGHVVPPPTSVPMYRVTASDGLIAIGSACWLTILN